MMKKSFGAVEALGFTLLELIVVIAIITLLAGLLTPLVKSTLDDAKVGKILSLKESIAKAAMKYWYDMDTLPEENEGAAPAVHNLFVDPGGASPDPKWKGPYLDAPLTKAQNPWTGNFELLSDITGEAGGFSIAGATPGGVGPYNDLGCELHLTKVPVDLAKKIDTGIDGTDRRDSGMCEYQDPAGKTEVEMWIFLFEKK